MPSRWFFAVGIALVPFAGCKTVGGAGNRQVCVP